MITYLELFGIAIIPALILLDLFYRARPQTAPRRWRLRALAVTVGTFFLALWTGGWWGQTLAGVSLMNATALGTWGGAALGILAYELVHYWYHRTAHAWTPLWRGAHQMHHSAESVDAFGAYYLHPLDTFFFTTWSSLLFFPVLGLAPEAAAVAAAFLGFNAMFQHANIRTPHWLGYLIQRPESHLIHHARGHHRQNYADLPLWDMVFGTFHNPRGVEGVECGFYDGASARVGDMLTGRDVSTPHGAALTVPGGGVR